MSLFFETINVQNGVIYNLNLHNKRLNHTISKHYKTDDFINLSNYIKPPNDNTLYRCKVIYDSKIKEVNFYPYSIREIKSFKIIQSNIKYPYKYLNRVEIDSLYLKKSDLDDILIVDKDGFLKDSSIANIAIKKDNTWFTPKNPLLFGTMREKFIEDKILHPKELKLKDIENIDSFAIMNAMIGFYEIKKPIFKI